MNAAMVDLAECMVKIMQKGKRSSAYKGLAVMPGRFRGTKQLANPLAQFYIDHSVNTLPTIMRKAPKPLSILATSNAAIVKCERAASCVDE